MNGYTNLIIVGGGIIAIAILRLMYGRMKSPQSQKEEISTHLALLFFVVAFSLTVLRSPTGVLRYQEDIAHSVPYAEKHVVLSPEDIGEKFSKSSPGNSHEVFTILAATVANDFDKLIKIFNRTLDPMQKKADSNAKTAALLPKDTTDSGLLKRLTAWLTSEGRAARMAKKQLTKLMQQKTELDGQMEAIRASYELEKYTGENNLHRSQYAEAAHQQDQKCATDHLIQAASLNVKLQKALIKGNDEREKAAKTLFIINWGCLLFVTVALGVRSLLRKLCPSAPWYILPGTFFLWGVSLVLMTDLGLNYVPRLRFIGYYNWCRQAVCVGIFVGAVLLCSLPVMRMWLAKLLERCRCTAANTTVTIIGLLLAAGIAGLFLRTQRVVSSELIKALAVLFLAWYALVRGDYLSRRSLINGNSKQIWLWKNVADLFVVSAATLLAFFLIRDFGPLLSVVILFCCYVWVLMGCNTLIFIVGGWSILLGVIWMMRNVLGKTSMLGHIYRRFAEMKSPYLEGSTELAKLGWLRKSAGIWGYDFGRIPFYGHSVEPGTATIVTPLQIQSDYTATHLIAQFGYLPGFVLLGVYLIWLLTLYQDASALAGDASKQAVGRFVGWALTLAILLMIIQIFLTIGGNFTLIPLTGVCLPYISFGGVSLLIATLVCAVSYAKEKLQ